jgi:hypothetical protein
LVKNKAGQIGFGVEFEFLTKLLWLKRCSGDR